MSTLVAYVATRDPFFELPESFEEALRSALPLGMDLVVCRDFASFPAALRTATAVVGWPFPPSLARRADRLRWVHFLSSGTPEGWDGLCIDGHPVRVTSAAAVNADSVAEHALFLVLAWLRGLERDSLASGWNPSAWAVARAPSRRVATVVGYGAVGRRIASLLAPHFHAVRIVSRTACAATAHTPEVLALDDAAPVLAASDLVVLAIATNESTRAFVASPAFFPSLRPDVAVVNVARGELVDEAALLAFLDANPRARYLADVARPEPYPDDGALRRHASVVLTPHLGGRREDLWDELLRHTLLVLDRELPAITEGA